MLGTAICRALQREGTAVFHLVRREPTQPLAGAGVTEVRWYPAAPAGGIDLTAIEGLDAVVHLSGANVAARRWTAAYKREITESRVGTTRALTEALIQLKTPPKVLAAASAVGFYGDRGDEILDENSPAGKGFFPELCQAWEAASQPAVQAGIRVVHLRFGMVIAREGGAVAKLTPLFRLGLGGRLGDGKQWVSWVSEADVVAAVLFAIRNDGISGPVNVVASEPVTNAQFTREMAHAVQRPAVVPVPAFALRLALGDMADEALLASTRVVPARLLASGFKFQHPRPADALAVALQSSSG
jgi:uncharacterized protein